MLEVLRSKNVETHLIISKAGEKVIEHELDASKSDLKRLANYVYDMDDWSVGRQEISSSASCSLSRFAVSRMIFFFSSADMLPVILPSFCFSRTSLA